MAPRKPIAERILETIITLHNKEVNGSSEELDEPKAFSAKLEEPVLTYLAERGYIIFGGPTGDIPFLNNYGKAYYQSIITGIQQNIIK